MRGFDIAENSGFRPHNSYYNQLLMELMARSRRILDRISREIYMLSVGNTGVFPGGPRFLHQRLRSPQEKSPPLNKEIGHAVEYQRALCGDGDGGSGGSCPRLTI